MPGRRGGGGRWPPPPFFRFPRWWPWDDERPHWHLELLLRVVLASLALGCCSTFLGRALDAKTEPPAATHLMLGLVVLPLCALLPLAPALAVTVGAYATVTPASCKWLDHASFALMRATHRAAVAASRASLRTLWGTGKHAGACRALLMAGDEPVVTTGAVGAGLVLLGRGRALGERTRTLKEAEVAKLPLVVQLDPEYWRLREEMRKGERGWTAQIWLTAAAVSTAALCWEALR